MTKLPTAAIVSLLATLSLGACATRAARTGPEERPHAATRTPAIRFDNDGRERVHVYLIGETREWLLGRVEPGVIARLPLPLQSLTGGTGLLRLAVVAGAPVSLQAAREARATITLAQPASALLEHRWTLVQGQLVPQWLDVRRAP